MNSDGNIRYFEYTNDKFEYLSEYKSADPQRGLAFLPKRGVNVHENEVARAYKTVNDAYVEPISFIVPRRAEVFQTDIYPPTIGLKSSMSSKKWFDGETALPPLISLKSRYDGGDSMELSPEEKAMVEKSALAAAVTSPPPTKTELPAPKPAAAPAPVEREPVPAAQVAPKAELKDNKQAMADMANKFADKDDEEEEEDDASSFEEVTKPVERPSRVADPLKLTSTPVQAISRAPAPSAAKPTPSAAPVPEPAAATEAPRTTASGPAEVLKGHLSDIKSAQANTRDEIAELKDQVNDLKDLVKTLSSRLDTLVGSQAERIRRIELEVEGLRE
jgi:coronin-1B/1C/6